MILCGRSNVYVHGAITIIDYLTGSDDNSKRKEAGKKERSPCDVICSGNKYGNTPLHFACYYTAPLEIIRHLVNMTKAGAEDTVDKNPITLGNIFGSTPLHFACSQSTTSLEVIQYLAEAGAAGFKGGKKAVVTLKNRYDEIPLHIACCWNNASLDVIRYLIQEGGKETVTYSTKNHYTPFHYAFQKKAPFEVIQYLIEVGGKDLVRLEVSPTPTPMPLSGSSTSVTSSTISTRSTSRRNSFELPIHYVCSFASQQQDHQTQVLHDVVKSLVRQGGKEAVVARDREGRNPLHYAVKYGAGIQVIRSLIKIGGKELVTSADNIDCDTPLHCACREGANLSVVKIIVKKGGGKKTILATNFLQNTPLHIACAQKRKITLDLIQFLVENGGTKKTLAVKNTDGDTPLHVILRNAVYEQSLEIIKYLIQQGGKQIITQANNYGETPILLAFRGGETTTLQRQGERQQRQHNAARLDVIRCLVQHGGPETVKAVDKHANTILHCIVPLPAKQSLDIIRYLLRVEGVQDALPRTNKDNKTAIQIALECHKRDFSPVIQTLFDAYVHHNLLSTLDHDCITETLKWTHNISKMDQEAALKHNFIRYVLNRKFVSPRFLAFLMLDLYTQIFLMYIFAIRFERIIKPVNGLRDNSIVAVIFVGLTLLWLIIREITQFYTTSYALYIKSTWNWMDIIQMTLVVLSSIIIVRHSTSNIDLHRGELWVLTLTSGMVWLQLIQVLSNLFYGISVFVAALQQIILSIVPFFITTLIIIFGFAQMFYISADGKCEMEGFQWACSLSESYFHSFDMLLSGIVLPHETVPNDFIVVSVCYAVVIGLILLNVLIAKISNVFTGIEEMGKYAFWENRLMFVTEVFFILDAVEKIFNKKTINTLLTSSSSLHRGERSTTEEVSVPSNKKLTPRRQRPPIFENDYHYVRQQQQQQLEKQKQKNEQERLKYPRRPFSTLTWNDYFDEDEDEDFKDFLFWWNSQNDSGWSYGEDAIPPPCLSTRFRTFLRRASYEDILYPDKELQGIWFGYRGFTSLMVNNILRFLIPVFVILFFFLGLISFGYFWPIWMKEWLFYGEADETTTTTTRRRTMKQITTPTASTMMITKDGSYINIYENNNNNNQDDETKREIKELKDEINQMKEQLDLILKKL